MAVIDTLSVSTPKKSWADIVMGRSSSKTERLRPAARGTHMCMCTGEFLVMLGHYGWIMALQDIDHPDADRHGGRIYLQAKDLRRGSNLKPGDEVTFFLYADKNGLGAEDCFDTNHPHPPQPPAPEAQAAAPKKHLHNRPKINRVSWPKQTDTNSFLSAAAQEFVPTVLVPVNADIKPLTAANLGATMNPGATDFVPAPPGLGPVFTAEADAFVPFTTPCMDHSMYCAFNAKRFYDDDDSSDDGTESTASDFSGRVLVAPGLSTHFVSTGTTEDWSTLSSRCAQAVVDADMDSDSWCDEESDDEPQIRVEEWAAVSARCAKAVGNIDQQHPWHVRNAAAAAKLKANVGNDIRWEVVLDALAELDGNKSFALPPGLAPPGLELPAHVSAPPGLA